MALLADGVSRSVGAAVANAIDKGTMDSLDNAPGASHQQVQARSTSSIAHRRGSCECGSAFHPDWSTPTTDEGTYPRHRDTA